MKEFSESHRAAIGAAKIGHAVSPETRAKISAALSGRPGHAQTEESIEKSASAKRKNLQDYEKESSWAGECLVHPAKSASDANRIARRVYQLRHGSIESRDIFVCHHCDYPWCIRDDHHFLGTHTDNMRDAAEKGRLKRSPEYWANFSAVRTGHEVTEATKRKISSSRKGKALGHVVTEETRQKISASNEAHKDKSSERQTSRMAALTQEQRSQRISKGWETRRKNAQSLVR